MQAVTPVCQPQCYRFGAREAESGGDSQSSLSAPCPRTPPPESRGLIFLFTLVPQPGPTHHGRLQSLLTSQVNDWCGADMSSTHTLP